MLDLIDADLYVRFEENKDTENKVYRISFLSKITKFDIMYA